MEINKQIFLDELPCGGKYLANTDINWIKSIGYKVKGIYDGMDFEIEIKEYITKTHMLTIIYNNGEFNSLKKCVLDSIIHDLNFNNELDPIVKEALNNLLNNK